MSWLPVVMQLCLPLSPRESSWDIFFQGENLLNVEMEKGITHNIDFKVASSNQ
jgi:hypothetical protein